MDDRFFNKVNINKENTYVPITTGDIDSELLKIRKLIEEKGGTDIQLLGVGSNGHIAFNEPGTSFETQTHKVALTESTIEANQRFFDSSEDVPRFAYTMGLKSIMNAKKIILLAYGEAKADALQKVMEGPITEDVPATILKNHPNVIIIADQAAASKI